MPPAEHPSCLRSWSAPLLQPSRGRPTPAGLGQDSSFSLQRKHAHFGICIGARPAADRQPKAELMEHPLHTPPRSGGRTSQTTPVCRMQAAFKFINQYKLTTSCVVGRSYIPSLVSRCCGREARCYYYAFPTIWHLKKKATTAEEVQPRTASQKLTKWIWHLLIYGSSKTQQQRRKGNRWNPTSTVCCTCCVGSVVGSY